MTYMKMIMIECIKIRNGKKGFLTMIESFKIKMIYNIETEYKMFSITYYLDLQKNGRMVADS